MDLSIIKEKLHSLQYTSAVDFVKDIRLMLSNCTRYNQVKTKYLLLNVYEVKSVHEPSGQSGRYLSWFLLQEATRSMSILPLGCMLVHGSVTPALNLRTLWLRKAL